METPSGRALRSQDRIFDGLERQHFRPDTGAQSGTLDIGGDVFGVEKPPFVDQKF